MYHPERADRVNFDPRVRLEFRGAQFSSDRGLLVIREMDDALWLSDLACGAARYLQRKEHLPPVRRIFRQSVFGRLAGCEDVNDADLLALDPVMRQVSGGGPSTRKQP